MELIAQANRENCTIAWAIAGDAALEAGWEGTARMCRRNATGREETFERVWKKSPVDR